MEHDLPPPHPAFAPRLLRQINGYPWYSILNDKIIGFPNDIRPANIGEDEPHRHFAELRICSDYANATDRYFREHIGIGDAAITLGQLRDYMNVAGIPIPVHRALNDAELNPPAAGGAKKRSSKSKSKRSSKRPSKRPSKRKSKRSTKRKSKRSAKRKSTNKAKRGSKNRSRSTKTSKK